PAGNNPDRITGAAALPEVITVGALDQWKRRALFSGQGPAVVDAVPIPKPDLAEPGVAIFGPSYDSVPFRYGSGTLQAAAHFAGIYALLKEVRPQESPDSFLYAMATTTADLGTPGVDMETGMGLPDPNAALYFLENPPTEEPVPTFYINKP
ncbi:MAG TPA: S8 family serine peptidase, partial [Candidatus Ozemobacteraceae bacterium]|nr:S8 family serine peptidase [Candidatus Ozemobacteraceae bacterium]